MLVPLINLILGLLILGYGMLAYLNPSSAPDQSAPLPQREKLLWLLGYSLIAAAFILGMIGYWGLLASDTVRLTRIGLGLAGLVTLVHLLLKPDPES